MRRSDGHKGWVREEVGKTIFYISYLNTKHFMEYYKVRLGIIEIYEERVSIYQNETRQDFNILSFRL